MRDAVTRKILLVAGLPILIGAAVAAPVGLLGGSAHWGFAAIAFGLCVPPGLVGLVLGDYVIRTSPLGRLLAVLVGSFVRLVVGFGGGMVVFLVAGPDGRADRIAFWLWVLFAYLTTLATETALMAGPVKVSDVRAAAEGGSHGG